MAMATLLEKIRERLHNCICLRCQAEKVQPEQWKKVDYNLVAIGKCWFKAFLAAGPAAREL
eukprot:1149286-Pelagomonas_calceolata.AAC.1